MEQLTNIHHSNVLKCIIDEPDELKQMRFLFSEEEVGRIIGEPDYDGKYRFLIEFVRIHTSPPIKGASQ